MKVNPFSSVQEHFLGVMLDVLADGLPSSGPGSSIPEFCNEINTNLNYTSVLLPTKL